MEEEASREKKTDSSQQQEQKHKKRRQPNIILMLADDLGIRACIQFINWQKAFVIYFFFYRKRFQRRPLEQPRHQRPKPVEPGREGNKAGKTKRPEKKKYVRNVNVFCCFPELVLLRVLLRAQPRRPPHGTLSGAQEGAEQNGKKFLSRLLLVTIEQTSHTCDFPVGLEIDRNLGGHRPTAQGLRTRFVLRTYYVIFIHRAHPAI